MEYYIHIFRYIFYFFFKGYTKVIKAVCLIVLHQQQGKVRFSTVFVLGM